MPSFTTINDPVNKGATKYENFDTLEKAEARIVELHALGFTDAFIIDDDATAVNDRRCFQTGQHWTADPVAKTVTLDQASLNLEIREGHMATLRTERNEQLEESDKNVLPDRWHTMDAATQAKWTTYRQELRDLPANTVDPAKPVWPAKP